MEDQFSTGAEVCIHVTPELTDTKILPIHPLPLSWNPIAASFVPSAEEAMETQFPRGALVCIQLMPELVEMLIPP